MEIKQVPNEKNIDLLEQLLQARIMINGRASLMDIDWHRGLDKPFVTVGQKATYMVDDATNLRYVLPAILKFAIGSDINVESWWVQRGAPADGSLLLTQSLHELRNYKLLSLEIEVK